MVSVIVPYKTDRGYLGEALNSIHQQTYKDYEIILSQSDNTVGVNINEGIKKAKGKYICYLCDDDMLTQNSLKDRVEFLDQNNFDFIHTYAYWYQDGKTNHYGLTNPYTQFNSVLESNGIHGGTVMYKREIFEKHLYNEELTTGEEWEFHLRILKDGYRLGFCDTYSYLYRRHSEQKSIGNLSTEYQSKRDIIKQQIRSWYI